MRSVVTEIEGDLSPREYGGSGSSARHVFGLSVRRQHSAAPPRTSEQRREIMRAAAATRCDLLNRLDEIAREAQGAVA